MPSLKINRISPPGRNFFFGFHDLCITDSAGRIAAMEVSNIASPPLPGQEAQIGYFLPNDATFYRTASSVAFNYPQGARLQWWNNHDGRHIFNDQVGDHWGARIVDLSGNTLCILDSTAHAIVPESDLIFGINYARLNRLGVYGYTGLADPTAGEKAPQDDGIWVNHITENRPELLIAIADVAAFQGKYSANTVHYLTHLVLSPHHKRLAFLHRYRNGEGETTRLMTFGIDGSNLRCLGRGFLSHFDWADDNHVMIWGRVGAIEQLRSSWLYAMLPKTLLRQMKQVAKNLLRPPQTTQTASAAAFMRCYSDEPVPSLNKIAATQIRQDGHPMYNRAFSDWFVCDTYPDENGVRCLFLCQRSTGNCHELGKFKRLFADADTSALSAAFEHLDPDSFPAEYIKTKLPFARSGLHCDLHPRWSLDGGTVFFDSIHEGERAIYAVDVRDIISEGTSKHEL